MATQTGVDVATVTTALIAVLLLSFASVASEKEDISKATREKEKRSSFSRLFKDDTGLKDRHQVVSPDQ